MCVGVYGDSFAYILFFCAYVLNASQWCFLTLTNLKQILCWSVSVNIHRHIKVSVDVLVHNKKLTKLRVKIWFDFYIKWVEHQCSCLLGVSRFQSVESGLSSSWSENLGVGGVLWGHGVSVEFWPTITWLRKGKWFPVHVVGMVLLTSAEYIVRPRKEYFKSPQSHWHTLCGEISVVVEVTEGVKKLSWLVVDGWRADRGGAPPFQEGRQEGVL